MQPFKNSILWAKTASLRVFLVVLLCVWASPVLVAADNGGSQHPKPPLREGSAPKPFTWDNDVTICTGPVSGGISVDYDTSGNVYAVRCTTWNGVVNACVKVSKSTDGGKGWSELTSFATVHSYSYPVVLTGTTGNKLYVFYLYSYQNGSIRVHRYDQSGMQEGTYDVKVGADTITYFSACVDYENGNHLMVAYQKEEMGDDTPDLYTITSTDYGETWSNEVLVSGAGAHPDIAYGRNGYVYLVFDKIGVGPDQEICFTRSNNYCVSGSWQYGQWLTWDSYDDNYPKVAAVHMLPDSTPYVWVAYNHKPGAYCFDLRYAYSSNGGKDWIKNGIVDASTTSDAMACDLWTQRVPGGNVVNVCYLFDRRPPMPRSGIYYRKAFTTFPSTWGVPHQIANRYPSRSEDGREVCQGTYAQGNPAIMYAGKEPDDYYGDNFQNLWFDNRAWPVDVEEEMTEEEVPAEFSLSSNYPNPFNPETRISYFIPRVSHVKLQIFNILGHKIRTLVDEDQAAGRKGVLWDGRDDQGEQVASGVYLYRLQAGDLSESKKMVLMR